MSNEYDHQFKNINYFYGPYLYHGSVDPKFTQALLQEGAKCTEDQDMRDNLAGDLKQEYKFTPDQQKWFARHMRLTFNHYVQSRMNWHALPKDKIPDYIIENVWINYQYKNDYQPDHVHAGDFSWVIYIQIPETIKKEREKWLSKGAPPGTVTFAYGEAGGPLESSFAWAVQHQNFTPVVNEFFIFPAQLRHSVPPFKGEGCRISVSGNGSFQRADGENNNYVFGEARQ